MSPIEAQQEETKNQARYSAHTQSRLYLLAMTRKVFLELFKNIIWKTCQICPNPTNNVIGQNLYMSCENTSNQEEE